MAEKSWIYQVHDDEYTQDSGRDKINCSPVWSFQSRFFFSFCKKILLFDIHSRTYYTYSFLEPSLYIPWRIAIIFMETGIEIGRLLNPTLYATSEADTSSFWSISKALLRRVSRIKWLIFLFIIYAADGLILNCSSWYRYQLFHPKAFISYVL